MASGHFWVGSYPKSGNTWVRLLMTAWNNGGELQSLSGDKLGQTDLTEYFYRTVSVDGLYESYRNAENEDGEDEEVEVSLMPPLRGAALHHMSASQYDAPLWLKTHHANADLQGFPMIPVHYVTAFLYVVRDPRDVVPSFSEYMGLDIDGTIDFMADRDARLMKDEADQEVSNLFHVLGSWDLHVISYYREARFPVHIVRYEDLQEDAVGELEAMLNFLGIEDPDEEQMERTVKACEFDRLSKMEDEAEGGFEENLGQGDKFFRRGEVGSHEDELTAEQEERVIEHFGDEMAELGYLKGTSWSREDRAASQPDTRWQLGV